MVSSGFNGMVEGSRETRTADSTVFSCEGLLTAQPTWGCKAMRAPLAPPRLSLLRKVEAEPQAAATRLETVKPLVPRILAFRAVSSPGVMRPPDTLGRGSCQMKRCFGTSGPR